jgi:hypothetical protein
MIEIVTLMFVKVYAYREVRVGGYYREGRWQDKSKLTKKNYLSKKVEE